MRFTTHASLGNAEQQTQRRKPPFKVLDTAEVAGGAGTWPKLREIASGGNGVVRHGIRLRCRKLVPFSAVVAAIAVGNGTDEQLRRQGGLTVSHPEVQFPVDSRLYLGFGPVKHDKNSKATKHDTEKSHGEQRTAIDDKGKGESESDAA